MLDIGTMMTALYACIAAALVSAIATPLVKRFAERIGAVDVPKDNRRMHSTPIPRAGGLAIFIGFLAAYLVFGSIDGQTRMILLGALIIVALGVVDDVVELPAKIKFAGQIIAALIPVLAGVRISFLSMPFVEGGVISLGVIAIPFTVVWIVGITNAVNFIDGLDGLACGVSTIASITMFTIAVLLSEGNIAIAMAALVGGCFGFLPYNLNPAKIFMGDTGAMFLGYILATLSVQGLFKFYAVVSFAVPFLLLALPIIDTLFAILRRVFTGKSPLQADRGHIHHRLIDMGLGQKQSVAILYIVSGIMGLLAIVLTASGDMRYIILGLAVIISFLIAVNVIRNEYAGKEQLRKSMEARRSQLPEDEQDEQDEVQHEQN